jgi:hypothetical protein
MNMQATANRAWRSISQRNGGTDDAPVYFDKTAVISSFGDSYLIFNFLTPHPSLLLEPRNCVPYYELPIYRSINFDALQPYTRKMAATGLFPAPSSAILNSNSIQLSTVPDKLIVFVRRPVGSQTCSGTDSYLTITNISINWNNQAGLLSSMSPEQLYMFSVQSGLANLSWDEFSGQVVSLFRRCW